MRTRLRHALTLWISLLIAAALHSAEKPQPIRLLTIGHSLTRDATEFLDELCRAGGRDLVMKRANLGGASLERHATHLAAWQTNPEDPQGRPYRDRDSPDAPAFSLIEALQAERWDFVTVTHASRESFKPDSYEPHGGRLIEAIRRHAPTATVLVVQTPAYREDHAFFTDGQLTQGKMYEGLRDAYRAFAQRHRLPIVPVADAFQIARSAPLWRFVHPDPRFDYTNPPPGSLPDQAGSLNVGGHWKQDPKGGPATLQTDANHANTAGRYLGACVFYEVLTGTSVLNLSWRPDGLSAEQALSLRNAAHQAVAAQKTGTRSTPLGHAPSPDASRPNIVFILTDDQGYGDVSAHGNPILRTPNLDRLYAESVRFEDFHVSPTCAPTRSALFTGRHEFKNGVTHTILERERLTRNAITLAEVLRDAGYATGIFGKWHLGDEQEYLPNARGFDEMFIHGGGGIGQVYPGSCGDAPGNTYFDPFILHNDRFVKTTGYCTDVFYRQAIAWMDTQRRAKKPFFAYIPSNAPHAPYVARPEDAALYEGRVATAQLAHFFGMIHNIDENIGRVLAKLEAWGIERDTLVIFMNDNGTAAGSAVFNAGMRGAKGTAWLGGTRSSSFWRWPRALNPGATKALTAHIDVLPTLAELAGATLSAEARRQVEGRSLVPLLRNPGAEWPDRPLFTHRGRWPKFADPDGSKFSMAAVRNSRWSLVSEDGGREPNWQLFDLRADYGQRHNVAALHPEVVRELAATFDHWWAECLPMMVNERAVGPKLNPFAVRYWAQFGGGPTAADYERMDPSRPFVSPSPKGAKSSAVPKRAP
jgi:arylsulfatase A-like enzyme